MVVGCILTTLGLALMYWAGYQHGRASVPRTSRRGFVAPNVPPGHRASDTLPFKLKGES